ncbi:hypothetical protein NAT51_00650 [Flavobacterium amniphilum]|uniref:hypothetical protein n=1 Tax=Flavobacterium amniphilum TaxID=1834035 RepID=UPI002029D7F4|nr:hypothetical protein [Flavobacterium amniphilum]MCL9804012.1 hypothetical protein [Flavobacterium amniphilum]
MGYEFNIKHNCNEIRKELPELVNIINTNSFPDFDLIYQGEENNQFLFNIKIHSIPEHSRKWDGHLYLDIENAYLILNSGTKNEVQLVVKSINELLVTNNITTLLSEL